MGRELDLSVPYARQGNTAMIHPHRNHMARDWAATFDSWSKPVSNTENEKCERAERMIRDAIAQSDTLKHRSIRVFTQGSYRNDTNVRQDSDVDIAVCCTDIFVPDFSLAKSLSSDSLGLEDAKYTLEKFKDDVGVALVNYFGQAGVTRGNKAFDVHENTARVDADVVPCVPHRLYFQAASRNYPRYVDGTHIKTDKGEHIHNYPDQHAEEGKKKNAATALVFKRVVRIFKRLRNEMKAANVAAAAPVASFLIESLVWNVPDASFTHDTFYEDVRAVLIELYAALTGAGTADQWTEVNGIKFLFHVRQGWTKQQAIDFVTAAWSYVGFSS